jgi:hypothetical protein
VSDPTVGSPDGVPAAMMNDGGLREVYV